MATTGPMPPSPGPQDTRHHVAPALKRTYRLVGFATDGVSLLTRGGDIVAIWFGKRLGAPLREQVMFAVACANACRHCGFIHATWARRVGVEAEQIERIYTLEREGFEPRTYLALAFARARVAAEFDRIDTNLEREFLAEYDEQQAIDIDLVARVMNFANRATNTLDALLARIQGEPYGITRPLDEWVVGGLAAAGLATTIPAMCYWRRQGPAGLYRDFQAFSRDFYRRLLH